MVLGVVSSMTSLSNLSMVMARSRPQQLRPLEPNRPPTRASRVGMLRSMEAAWYLPANLLPVPLAPRPTCGGMAVGKHRRAVAARVRFLEIRMSLLLAQALIKY